MGPNEISFVAPMFEINKMPVKAATTNGYKLRMSAAKEI
jgi:hypothetical protein